MSNKYYLTQEYIFRCIKKHNYESDNYDKYFNPGICDYLYQITIILGYKDSKLYFPYINYKKENDNLNMFMGEEYISIQYGNIFIKYDTIEDIYNFIKTLLFEFPKDIIFNEDVSFKNGICEIDLQKSYEHKCVFCDGVYTIHEDFTLEYFINKINRIINIEEYVCILDKLKYQYDCFGRFLTIPLTGMAPPSNINDKLKQDYPILEKWL